MTSITKDGKPHQGLIMRIKHCFGRGLLLYSDVESLEEKETVRLELTAGKERTEAFPPTG